MPLDGSSASARAATRWFLAQPRQTSLVLAFTREPLLDGSRVNAKEWPASAGKLGLRPPNSHVTTHQKLQLVHEGSPALNWK